MALIKRLSRLFAADMHAVLDQLEEPESVLKQAIREMEEELARQELRCKWLDKEIDATGIRIKGVAESVADLDAKLDTCFESGNDTLARKLTRRKLENRMLAERITSKQVALRDERAESQAAIAANRGQLDSLRQKAELLAAERPACSRPVGDEPSSFVDDDEVEIAFLREKQARATS